MTDAGHDAGRPVSGEMGSPAMPQATPDAGLGAGGGRQVSDSEVASVPLTAVFDAIQAHSHADELARCANWNEMAEVLERIESRLDEYAGVMEEANSELPDLHRSVLNVGNECPQALKDRILLTAGRLDLLQIEGKRRLVGDAAVCVDIWREITDEAMSSAASDVRLRRINAEMTWLMVLNARTLNREQVLLRAHSKQSRLAQELGQLEQELQHACR